MQNKEKKSRKGLMGWVIAGLMLLGGAGIYQSGGLGLLPGGGSNTASTQKKDNSSTNEVVKIRVNEDKIYLQNDQQEEKEVTREDFVSKLKDLNSQASISLVDDQAIKDTFDFVKQSINDLNFDKLEIIEQ